METQDQNKSSCNWGPKHDKEGHLNFFDQIPGKPSLQEMQQIVLTSTAHILQKVLSK